MQLLSKHCSEPISSDQAANDFGRELFLPTNREQRSESEMTFDDIPKPFSLIFTKYFLKFESKSDLELNSEE